MRDDRHWDQPTDSRHVYVETSTTRILGALRLSYLNGTYEAYAYARSLGEYISADVARLAVEQGCAEVERQERLRAEAEEAKRNQADGVME